VQAKEFNNHTPRRVSHLKTPVCTGEAIGAEFPHTVCFFCVLLSFLWTVVRVVFSAFLYPPVIRFSVAFCFYWKINLILFDSIHGFLTKTKRYYLVPPPGKLSVVNYFTELLIAGQNAPKSTGVTSYFRHFMAAKPSRPHL